MDWIRTVNYSNDILDFGEWGWERRFMGIGNPANPSPEIAVSDSFTHGLGLDNTCVLP